MHKLFLDASALFSAAYRVPLRPNWSWAYYSPANLALNFAWEWRYSS